MVFFKLIVLYIFKSYYFIFLVSILLLFFYLIKLVVDVFFNNSIYFSLTYELSPTLNLIKSPNFKKKFKF